MASIDPKTKTLSDRRRRRRVQRFRRFVALAALPILALVSILFSTIFWKHQEDTAIENISRPIQADFPPVQWNPNLFHKEARCQKPIHFPFRTGCPYNCSSFRENAEADDFYRLTTTWEFGGDPAKYNASLPWSEQTEAFGCPERFVQTFTTVQNEIKTQTSSLTCIPEAKFKPQKKRMHMALSYLCCLTKKEVNRARKIILDWISKSNFDFAVHFDEIQCWHETPSSVTNIAVPDDPSQRRLMRLNHDLNDRLRSGGIPVVIPREDQMPFHSTLAGIQLGSNTESFDPNNNISSQLPQIYDMISSLSVQYKGQWHPHDGVAIHHDPQVYRKGILHTYPLIDYAA